MTSATASRRRRWARSAVCSLFATGLAGCGSGGNPDDSSSSNGTGNETTGSETATSGSGDTGGSGGSGATTTGSGGDSTTTSAGTGGGGADGSVETTSGGGTAAGGNTFTEEGVCGVRSEGTVTIDSYDAVEEFFLLGDSGFGDELCVVRFSVTRVGDAPPGCDENAGQQQECLWTHLVEYSDPEVVLDVDGACENSELGLDDAGIAAIDGSQVAVGYVFEYQGHNSVLMVYDPETDTWDAGVSAGWAEDTGDLLFNRRDGFCGY